MQSVLKTLKFIQKESQKETERAKEVVKAYVKHFYNEKGEQLAKAVQLQTRICNAVSLLPNSYPIQSFKLA
jgi:hypothetical protein